MHLYRIKGIGNKKKRILSPVKLNSPHLEYMGESKAYEEVGYLNGVAPQSKQGKRPV